MPIMVLVYIDTVNFAMAIIFFELFFMTTRPNGQSLSLLGPEPRKYFRIVEKLYQKNLILIFSSKQTCLYYD